jgi:hypothetical protein
MFHIVKFAAICRACMERCGQHNIKIGHIGRGAVPSRFRFIFVAVRSPEHQLAQECSAGQNSAAPALICNSARQHLQQS